MNRVCPACGQQSPANARFCFNTACGRPFDAAGPTAAPGTVPVVEETRRSVLPWVLGVVAAVVLAGGIAAWFVLGRSDDTATTTAPKNTVTIVSTTAPALTVPTTAAATATTRPALRALPRTVIAQATASSTLPEDRANRITYGIDNTLDGDLKTAWNSAGSDGDRVPPEGQWLEYRFAAAQPVSQIRIINGFKPLNGRSEFTDNHRIKTVRITTSNQTLEGTLVDDDKLGPSIVRLNGAPTEFVRITIVSTYPSTGKAYNDVGVTDVAFFVGG